jgi:glutathione S-transferase
MTDEVTFYHNPQSRATMAHWMLEEVGASYKVVPISFDAGENKTPEFLAINPMGKLPTIVHRGVTVTETGAIIAYLADNFPQAGLAPAPTDPQRGAYYRWLFFGSGCIEPALIDAMLQREPGRPMALPYGTYEDTFNTLRKALTPGPFLLGDRFSAADLYVGSELNWATMFGAPGIKDDPVFTPYIERLKARPAYQRVAAG